MSSRVLEAEEFDVVSKVGELRIPGDEFASRFIHDVRACLRAVETLPDWIEKDLQGVADKVPEDVYLYLTAIKVNARRADRLVNDVRELLAIGALEDPVTELDQSASVWTFVDDHEHPSGFNIKLGPTEQECAVQQASLHKVLSRLVDNAVKH